MQTPSQRDSRRRSPVSRRGGRRRATSPALPGEERAAPASGSTAALPGGGFSRLRVARQLPLSLLATLSVLVLPAVLVARLIPPRGLLPTLASAALAAVISLLIAGLEATAWEVRGRRSDLVFSELMLWGLARRWWAERRLDRLSVSYERAARADMTIRVELLEGIARLLEARSPYTYGHCRRVARHAERIARAMHLTPAEVATIRTASLVHDVGKIYTPRELLQKPGPLTDEEFAIVRRHSEDGADMVAPVKDPALAAIVRHHHERFAGRGYPEGLIGEEIPLGARIIAVADTFDVITSRRSYRPARSQREALAVLQAEAGAQLDRRVVDAFLECCSARRSVLSLAFLTALSERVAGALRLLPGGLGLPGGSAAQLLPALGAAGVLALTPGSRHERSPSSGVTPSAVSQRTASSPAASPSTLPGSDGRSVKIHRTGRRGEPRGNEDERRRSPGVPVAGDPTTAASPGAPAQEQPAQAGQHVISSSPGEESSSTAASAEAGQVSEAPTEAAAVASQQTPAITTPQVTTPAITTPAISTPAISTPAITLPLVKLPPLNIPSIAVAPVTVPSISLPGLKLPLGH